MIIEYPISIYSFATINIALFILACCLLKNEVRKCKKRANREKFVKDIQNSIGSHKKNGNHHSLINKKLPVIKLKTIKVDSIGQKKEEIKTGNVLSLKFTVPQEISYRDTLETANMIPARKHGI